MNILPKKRWHVRTKENVARVRRDEAAAAAEEKANAARAALAEQEARTHLLLARAGRSSGPAAKDEPGRHVNFFEDSALQGGIFAINAEAELEKKQQQEKEERRIGLLRYLGEGSSEYEKSVPWYQKPSERFGMGAQSSAATEQKPTSVRDQETVVSSVQKGKRPKDSLERLRQQRLAREREEKMRTAHLFRSDKEKHQEEGGKSKRNRDKHRDRRKQQYSAQFNPHYAKQNQR